ncbi:MAG: metal ABC transporter substrate-binding protein [Planctomycetota bacterium]
MKLLHALLAVLALASPSFADKLKVVTTLPDLADLAQIVGGDQVDVTAICKGTENVHAVRLKPSHVVATSKCDCFVQMGLSLEHAWVPGLLKTARNPRLEPGKPGLVTATAGFAALDVPESLSRKEGVDLHPEGNPHVNLDPTAGRHMARQIHASLCALRPEAKAKFDANLKAFETASTEAEARWKALAGELKGRPAVVYHSEFTYLLRSLGVEVIATIEPKPGVPPTPGHLAEVLATVQKRAEAGQPIAVLTAAWSQGSAVDRVAEASPVCKKVVLASMAAEGTSWLANMEALHRKLAQAYGVQYPVPDAPGAGESQDQ